MAQLGGRWSWFRSRPKKFRNSIARAGGGVDDEGPRTARQGRGRCRTRDEEIVWRGAPETGSVRPLAVALVATIAFGSAIGCERSADASRALVAERRAAWAREIAGIREQQAALASRMGSSGAGTGDSPAVRRTRAVLDGARQSIADVENQLTQASTRMEHEIRRGGEAGRQAIDDESARARGYLQSLGDQLGAAAQQVEELARNEDETNRQAN